MTSWNAEHAEHAEHAEMKSHPMLELVLHAEHCTSCISFAVSVSTEAATNSD